MNGWRAAFVAGLIVAMPSMAVAGNVNFSDHPIGRIYKGKAKLPDYKGRNEEFAPFDMRIANAMSAGSTFAGDFTIVQFGCGTGCSGVVVANRRNGKLYSFPRGGERNQDLTLAYKVNSNLVLARWFTDSFWETCVYEAFLFEDGKWIAKEAIAAKGDEVCSGDVAEGVRAAKTR